jgi:hypothetical protein
MTEDEAVLSCQNGDKDAFRYLVDLYRDVVFGTAYLIPAITAWPRNRCRRPF